MHCHTAKLEFKSKCRHGRKRVILHGDGADALGCRCDGGVVHASEHPLRLTFLVSFDARVYGFGIAGYTMYGERLPVRRSARLVTNQYWSFRVGQHLVCHTAEQYRG